MPEKVSFTIKLPCKKARDPKDRKSRIRLSNDVLSDLHMVSDAAASQILQCVPRGRLRGAQVFLVLLRLNTLGTQPGAKTV